MWSPLVVAILAYSWGRRGGKRSKHENQSGNRFNSSRLKWLNEIKCIRARGIVLGRENQLGASVIRQLAGRECCTRWVVPHEPPKLWSLWTGKTTAHLMAWQLSGLVTSGWHLCSAWLLAHILQTLKPFHKVLKKSLFFFFFKFTYSVFYKFAWLLLKLFLSVLYPAVIIICNFIFRM